jgi:hypothetical protein
VTVAVQSGTRDLRGRSVTVTVAAGARVVLNDAPTSLSALPVGSAVTVAGFRAGGCPDRDEGRFPHRARLIRRATMASVVASR